MSALDAGGRWAVPHASAAVVETRITQVLEDALSGIEGVETIESQSSNGEGSISIEFSIDRTGGDYRNMDVKTDATGAVCAQACESEERCRAWAYVRPGYLGASARCFLKEKLTAPRRKPCGCSASKNGWTPRSTSCRRAPANSSRARGHWRRDRG